MPNDSRAEPITVGRRFRSIARSRQRRDQPQLVLGVLQEQVLGVAAGQGRLDLLALADAEHRRMLAGCVWSMPWRVEEGEQVGAGLSCGRLIAGTGRLKATARLRTAPHARVRRREARPWNWNASPPPSRPPEIVPGRPQRAWMDAFADRHPYRCLPLTMANTTGWEILCPVGFTAEWNGGTEQERHHAHARPSASPTSSDFVKSHFSPRRAHLPPRLPVPHPARLVDVGHGPAQPRQGRHPAAGRPGGDRLAAVPLHHELASSPGPGKVRFEKGEPFCFITLVAGQAAGGASSR